MAVINTITIISRFMRRRLTSAEVQSDLGMMYRSAHNVFIKPREPVYKRPAFARKSRGKGRAARDRAICHSQLAVGARSVGTFALSRRRGNNRYTRIWRARNALINRRARAIMPKQYPRPKIAVAIFRFTRGRIARRIRKLRAREINRVD